MDGELLNRSIIEVSPVKANQWEEYKGIRLEYLKQEPFSTPVSWEEEARKTDAEWQEEVALAAKQENYYICLAVKEGKAVGFIRGVCGGNGDPAKFHLRGFYVDKELRGKKIGERLLENLVDNVKAKGSISAIELEVNEKDLTASPARHLYEKAGFVTTGTKPHPVYGGYVQRNMSLRLK